MQKIRKAFTLVELIIVIAIIAILAVTAFLVLTKWLGKSRDSRRVSDLTAMDTALQVYVTEKNMLPRPDNAITINASGTAIGYQGIFGDSVKSTLSNITSKPIDPTDNLEYIYYTDATQKNYQLLGFTEQTSSVGNTANAVDYSVRFIQTRGSKLGILLSGDNTPINLISSVGTGLDVQNTTGSYNAYFDSSSKLSGTGAILQWLYPNVNNGGNGFDAPSSCPNGFIPVPGNKDFNQPGFCVAKYEMKQINGTAGYQNTSNNRITGINDLCPYASACANTTNAVNTLDTKIISKADGLPIVNLNQATAIEACSKIGAGYHLITNNEWMTIARNIEAQGQNRTGGIVGSGGIYRGKDLRALNGVFTANADPKSLDCNMGTDINGLETTGSIVASANSTACQLNGRNKRELYLSNGQTIRDIAGNVWEHVNAKNTIDGTGYNTMLANACNGTDAGNDGNATNNYDWYSFNYNATTDNVPQCNYFNGYSYAGYGPLILGLNANNGIGRIYSGIGTNTLVDRVFRRGGHGTDGANAGVFALLLNQGAGFQSYIVGFRCVR